MLKKQPFFVDFTREEDALQIHPRGAILSSHHVTQIWSRIRSMSDFFDRGSIYSLSHRANDMRH